MSKEIKNTHFENGRRKALEVLNAKDSYGTKLIPEDRLKQMVRDGKIEMTSDINGSGRVEIRWTASGKRETISTRT